MYFIISISQISVSGYKQQQQIALLFTSTSQSSVMAIRYSVAFTWIDFRTRCHKLISK